MTQGVQDVAIVLRRFDFGETSQTAKLFTRGNGRMSVLARGIKRQGPDLRGPMDLFAFATVEVLERPRTDLHLLFKYRVCTGFPRLRKKLARWRGAFYVLEILREGTRDGDPEPRLFDAAIAALAQLERARPDECGLITAWFELQYLDTTGAMPAFESCVRCGRFAPPTGPVRLVPALQGLLCRSCTAGGMFRLVTLKLGARMALDQLRAAQGPGDAAELPLGPDSRAELRAAMTLVMEASLERELPSTVGLHS